MDLILDSDATTTFHDGYSTSGYFGSYDFTIVFDIFLFMFHCVMLIMSFQLYVLILAIIKHEDN